MTSIWTALILRGTDSRCWKHSSEILVHIGMIASHSCCRFVGCTSMMRISRSTTPQRCSIGLRFGDCGDHLSKVNSLSSCSRNSLRWFELWDMVHYPAGINNGLPYLRYCPSLYCTYYYLFIFLICFLFFHVFFLYYDAVLTCQGTTDEN